MVRFKTVSSRQTSTAFSKHLQEDFSDETVKNMGWDIRCVAGVSGQHRRLAPRSLSLVQRLPACVPPGAVLPGGFGACFSCCSLHHLW